MPEIPQQQLSHGNKDMYHIRIGDLLLGNYFVVTVACNQEYHVNECLICSI